MTAAAIPVARVSPKADVSLVRLYSLRAGYLLLVVGLGMTIWPALIDHASTTTRMHSVVLSMLGALSLVAVLGLRYPLRMLPLLLFELVWKTIWLLAVALPRWLNHSIDADIAETLRDCLVGVIIFPVLIPWGYVWKTYIVQRSERWR